MRACYYQGHPTDPFAEISVWKAYVIFKILGVAKPVDKSGNNALPSRRSKRYKYQKTLLLRFRKANSSLKVSLRVERSNSQVKKNCISLNRYFLCWLKNVCLRATRESVFIRNYMACFVRTSLSFEWAF